MDAVLATASSTVDHRGRDIGDGLVCRGRALGHGLVRRGRDLSRGLVCRGRDANGLCQADRKHTILRNLM